MYSLRKCIVIMKKKALQYTRVNTKTKSLTFQFPYFMDYSKVYRTSHDYSKTPLATNFIKYFLLDWLINNNTP